MASFTTNRPPLVRQTDQASTSGRCAARLQHGSSLEVHRASHRCSGSRFNEFSLWRGDLPVHTAPPQQQGVVPGARTTATPVLSPQQAMDRLHACVHANAKQHFGAFYSSELGGITTHPAVMLVHIDDHMVHAGHAVFDTALIVNGHLYQLPQHMQRFKRSAYRAGVVLPLSDRVLLRVILDTAAASRMKDGIIKVWASPGRGSLGISRAQCIEPTLYVMASSETTQHSTAGDSGLAACASPVSPKTAPYGTIKSTNYLPNALAQLLAEQQGLDVGLFVDDQGFILEGPNSNFAMLTHDNVLVTPPFTGILAGITIQTLLELVTQALEEGSPDNAIAGITKVEQRPIHSDELATAREAFLVGSTKLAAPITSWNGKAIGDGKPGPVAAALAGLLLQHRQTPLEYSLDHIPIPYSNMVGRV